MTNLTKPKHFLAKEKAKAYNQQYNSDNTPTQQQYGKHSAGKSEQPVNAGPANQVQKAQNPKSSPSSLKTVYGGRPEGEQQQNQGGRYGLGEAQSKEDNIAELTRKRDEILDVPQNAKAKQRFDDKIASIQNMSDDQYEQLYSPSATIGGGMMGDPYYYGGRPGS